MSRRLEFEDFLEGMTDLIKDAERRGQTMVSIEDLKYLCPDIDDDSDRDDEDEYTDELTESRVDRIIRECTFKVLNEKNRKSSTIRRNNR